MKKKIGRQLLCIGALVASTILWGCDSLSDQSVAESDASTTWSRTDGKTIKVILDDAFIGNRQVFTTEEAYHKRVDGLLEQTSIRVNADLYHALSHGNNPAEISLLDAKGRIAVGGYTYIFTREGIYEKRSNDATAEPELVFYYGLSGDEDYQEFIRAARAYSGADVSMEDFRNPFAKEMAAEALALRKAEQQRPQRDQAPAKSATSCSTWTASNHRNIGDCTSSSITHFPYGTSSILPSSHDRSAGFYNMRVRIINQSYRKGLKKKAYGLTGMSIRKSGSGDPFFGLFESSCPTYNVIERSGTLEFWRTGDYFSVGVSVEDNDNWVNGRCEVSDKVDRSGGTQSWHTAKYKDIYLESWINGDPYVYLSGPHAIVNNGNYNFK